MPNINGVPLRTFGFVLEAPEGDLAAGVGAPPMIAVPGARGVALTGAAGEGQARTLTLRGTLLARSAALLDDSVRALLAHCGGVAAGPTAGPVTITLPSSPDRAWTGYLTTASSASRVGPAERTAAAALSLVFSVPDPVAFDVVPTVRPLDTLPVECAVGTAASTPRLTLPGPWTARTVTLRDAIGVERGRLVLTAPGAGVLAGESVEVDGAAWTVTHVSATGVRTARPEWVTTLTGGTFLALDPAHVLGVERWAWVDRFDRDSRIDYTAGSCTLTWLGPTAGALRVTATGADTRLYVGSVMPDFAGDAARYVVLRYRWVSGSPPASGQIYYGTASHGIGGLYQRSFTLRTDGAWALLVLDMHALSTGGTDWRDSVITDLRIDLTESLDAVIEIDLWGVAEGRLGASVLGPLGVAPVAAGPSLALDAGTGTVTYRRAWR